MKRILEKMKIKKVEVLIQTDKEFRQKLMEDARKIDKGERKLISNEAIIFDSIDQFRKIMTNKRIGLLKAIRHKKPKSVYELAKLVKRSVDNVNNDVRLLEQMGFLETEKAKEGRNKLTPLVDFDKIEIELPI